MTTRPFSFRCHLLIAPGWHCEKFQKYQSYCISLIAKANPKSSSPDAYGLINYQVFFCLFVCLILTSRFSWQVGGKTEEKEYCYFWEISKIIMVERAQEPGDGLRLRPWANCSTCFGLVFLFISEGCQPSVFWDSMSQDWVSSSFFSPFLRTRV